MTYFTEPQSLEYLWSISKHMQIFRNLARENNYTEAEIQRFLMSKSTTFPPTRSIIEESIERQRMKRAGKDFEVLRVTPFKTKIVEHPAGFCLVKIKRPTSDKWETVKWPGDSEHYPGEPVIFGTKEEAQRFINKI